MQVNNCLRVGYLDHQAKHSSQSEMASVKAKNLDRLTFQARLLTKATIKCGKIEKFLSDCNGAGPVSAAPPQILADQKAAASRRAALLPAPQDFRLCNMPVGCSQTTFTRRGT